VPEIDHIFGEPWRGPVHLRRASATRHHGADIPAPDGTPILAIAGGVVIARFAGNEGFRGYEIVVRHAPADTGLPVWLYTAYTHFKEMPELRVGRRVRMCQKLGPTGKTGVPSRRRQEHLHLDVYSAKTDEFVAFTRRVVPVEGRYVDVVTLMRRRMPLDTRSMLELPAAERRVPIPHKLTTGAIVPPDTRIIWPYACRPR
jgi:murein DD-endopeptidase MepM/ murein hydrolase activator NlpD